MRIRRGLPHRGYLGAAQRALPQNLLAKAELDSAGACLPLAGPSGQCGENFGDIARRQPGTGIGRPLGQPLCQASLLLGLALVGNKGQVVGIDIKEPDRFSAPNFRFIKADILALDIQWLKKEIGSRSVVISDLAPQTTGINLADTSRSMELANSALRIAVGILQRNGHFFCKVFEGEDLKALRENASGHFNRVRIIRPSAVRKKSREVYLLGLRFAGSSSG